MTQAEKNTAVADSNISVLLAQRAELDKQIEQTKNAEKTEVIASIKQAMVDYDITFEDLTKKIRAAKSTKAATDPARKVAPKWQDPNSDATWTGRGKSPKWFNAETAIPLESQEPVEAE